MSIESVLERLDEQFGGHLDSIDPESLSLILVILRALEQTPVTEDEAEEAIILAGELVKRRG